MNKEEKNLLQVIIFCAVCWAVYFAAIGGLSWGVL